MQSTIRGNFDIAMTIQETKGKKVYLVMSTRRNTNHFIGCCLIHSMGLLYMIQVPMDIYCILILARRRHRNDTVHRENIDIKHLKVLI